MSTENEAPEKNTTTAQTAKRESNDDAQRSKWSRLASRPPTNPVARPSGSGDRSKRGRGGSARQRPQKHQSRGGQRGGAQKKPPAGLPADYDQPDLPPRATVSAPAANGQQAAPADGALTNGPVVEVYQPPVPEDLPDLYLTDLQKKGVAELLELLPNVDPEDVGSLRKQGSSLRSSVAICAVAAR